MGSGESEGPGLLPSRWWVSRTQQVAWGRPLRSHYDRVLVAMSYQRLLEVYSECLFLVTAPVRGSSRKGSSEEPGLD